MATVTPPAPRMKIVQTGLTASSVALAPTRGCLDFNQIPLDDPKVWSLFARGCLKGIFQCEASLGVEWSKKAQPKNIEELAAVISLIRPGPLEAGMAQSYVDRKHGREEVTYLHESLRSALEATYGCLIYQESVLRIVKDTAGFTEIEADLLRRALGKKKPEEVAKIKKLYLEKASALGVLTSEQADTVFGWIEKGQRYLFCAAHGVSYAIIAYTTAYIKAHFPTEFYTAWLTYSHWKPKPREEIYELVQDAKLNGEITVLPPDLRAGNSDFEIVRDRVIRFGLLHIRGVGEASAKTIKTVASGAKTWVDFLRSVPKLKRNVADALIKSGACDFYGLTRSEMLKQLIVVYGYPNSDEKQARRSLSDSEVEGVFDQLIDDPSMALALENLIKDGTVSDRRRPLVEAKLAQLRQPSTDTATVKSLWEKMFLGLNLTCSAADDIVQRDKNYLTCFKIYHDRRVGRQHKMVTNAVIDEVTNCRTGKQSKTPGRQYCRMMVSDNSGALADVVVWPDLYESCGEGLIEGTVIAITGHKDNWGGRNQFVADKIEILG